MDNKEQIVHFLTENPIVMENLLILREIGKCDLPVSVVNYLLSNSILSVDSGGVFVSDVVEDVIDDFKDRQLKI